MRFLKGCVVLGALALTLIVGTNCRPAPAKASEGMGLLRVGTTFASAAGDTVYVPLHWVPGAVQDGFGPIDGYATNGIRLTPTPIRDTLAAGWQTLASSARSDTVPIPMPTRLTNGQVATGKACVSQRRQGQRGQAKCPSWTFTMTVPPPGTVDSAWTGTPVTNIALGYLWQDGDGPSAGQPFLVGGLLRTSDSLGTYYSGVCLAALTTGGKIVLRPVGTGAGQTARQDCVNQRAKVWPGRTTVAYEVATSTEKAIVEPLRYVRFFVECGWIKLCRQFRAFGGDALGWRVTPELTEEQIRLDAVAILPSPEPEPLNGVGGYWLEVTNR